MVTCNELKSLPNLFALFKRGFLHSPFQLATIVLSSLVLLMNSFLEFLEFSHFLGKTIGVVNITSLGTFVGHSKFRK